MWSISFILVDFTLRNCTRVQSYVFTTLSGLFSHQSFEIWLSNKINSIHSSNGDRQTSFYICITCTFSAKFFVNSYIIQIRDCVNRSLPFCSWIVLAIHLYTWIKWDHFEHLEFNNHHCHWLIPIGNSTVKQYYTCLTTVRPYVSAYRNNINKHIFQFFILLQINTRYNALCKKYHRFRFA